MTYEEKFESLRHLLRSVTAHGSILISPEWLIDFMCGCGWRIVRKSEKHREIIKKYYSEM